MGGGLVVKSISKDLSIRSYFISFSPMTDTTPFTFSQLIPSLSSSLLLLLHSHLFWPLILPSYIVYAYSSILLGLLDKLDLVAEMTQWSMVVLASSLIFPVLVIFLKILLTIFFLLCRLFCKSGSPPGRWKSLSICTWSHCGNFLSTL